MATLIKDQTTRKGNNNTEQEYYNLYYSDDDNCVFTPSSKSVANALNADIVYKIVTNQLTNDVLLQTTKPYKKNGKEFVNFAVKVMPTAGENKDRYVPMGFINYFENTLTSKSSETDKTSAITDLKAKLEAMSPTQVTKHMTTADVKDIVNAL